MQKPIYNHVTGLLDPPEEIQVCWTSQAMPGEDRPCWRGLEGHAFAVRPRTCFRLRAEVGSRWQAQLCQETPAGQAEHQQ